MSATSTETIVVDRLSGEVIADELTLTRHMPKDTRPWVRLYLDAWATIKGLNGITRQTLDVLYLLLRLLPAAYNADEERPVISPSAYHKDLWAKELGTTRAVINKHLQKLVSQDVIARVARGAYVVNPQLIGYGAEVNIDKLTRIYGTFTIDADGATIQPVLVGDDALTDDDYEKLLGDK